MGLRRQGYREDKSWESDFDSLLVDWGVTNEEEELKDNEG
jgi:hypothetical protein